MSWQDDLRRLDADLAAGRIEPALHRKQRDELLAQASGSTVPSPVPSPLRRPGGEPAWHSTNPAYTQTVQNNAQHNVPPNNQSVQPPQQRLESPQPTPPQTFRPPPRPRERPPWAITDKSPSHPVPAMPEHLTTAPSPADINPTRYLRVDGPVADRPAPSRFPPIVPPQGQPMERIRTTDPDEPSGKHRWDDEHPPAEGGSGRRTWLFLTLGVFVVLAMIVGGTLWLGSDNDSAPPQANGPTVTPSVPAGAIGSLEERLPALPGKANPGNSTMSVAKAKELGLITQKVADLYTANGATDVIYRGANDQGTSILVLIATTSSPAAAQNVVDTQYRNALADGFKEVQSDLRTVSGVDRDTFLNTCWYGSGNRAVFIGIGQPFHGQAGLSADLDKAVKLYEQVLPAS